ncbi:flippase-like domain-containing protein [Acholeplasma sp. OttesenSCG-928-E16]|nr:flippase-like domain-containing protein [Acholeplasma sp. OttesenSCG-928-E16]
MDENNKNTIEEQPKTKKIWLNLIVVAIVLGLVVFLVYQLVGDINSVIEHFKQTNIWYILLAVALMLVFVVTTALSGHSVFLYSGEKINLTNSYLIQSTEMFFNGITPFSMGAAPIQGYYYHKCGASASKTTGVLLTQFIIYQLLITILSTVFLIIFLSDINIALTQKAGFGWYIIIIGYTINCIIFFFLIFLSFSKTTRKIVTFFIGLICKIKPLRKYKDKWLEQANIFTDNLQESMTLLVKNKKIFFISTLIRLISLLVYYSIPAVIVYAMGYNISNSSQFFYIMASSILATTTMMWVPLPGASGGTETAFLILLNLPMLSFSSESGSAVAAIMLLWRFITYYFGMVYGGINYLILKRRIK